MKKPGFVLSAIMLVLLLALPQLIGYVGATQTFTSVDTWYTTLTKPPLNPPDSTFGVVWTALYLIMGFASWLVWRAAGGLARAPLAFLAYFVQLALNQAWSFLFFGMQQPVSGLIDLVLLLAAIVLTTVLFWRKSKVAGALLLPYLAWVLFAGYLNAGIVVLNS
jgi:tryptophan-rich sensory protein